MDLFILVWKSAQESSEDQNASVMDFKSIQYLFFKWKTEHVYSPLYSHLMNLKVLYYIQIKYFFTKHHVLLIWTEIHTQTYNTKPHAFCFYFLNRSLSWQNADSFLFKTFLYQIKKTWRLAQYLQISKSNVKIEQSKKMQITVMLKVLKAKYTYKWPTEIYKYNDATSVKS